MKRPKNIVVCGAGGFIGGHLAKSLILKNFNVTCVDVKPFDLWFQLHDETSNYQLDLQDLQNCEKAVKNQDYVFNMACNMGGIGFIEWNRAKCMLSVLINTHLLKACQNSNVEKYFFSSSACAYNTNLQKSAFIKGLKEEDAYPAFPENGYGWEKLFSERMCKHFTEDFKLETRVARYHNIFGPIGTYDGGREKSPAALCRKIANAKLNNINEIEVWGDGEQTRSFLYVDDCVEATLNLFNSNYRDPLNIGSEEQVSINQMIEMIEIIADYKVNKVYKTNMPVGVRGRSSNNDKIKKELKWEPKISLFNGLENTYKWIFDMMSIQSNSNSIFTKS